MVLDLGSVLWYCFFEFTLLMIGLRCTYELNRLHALSKAETVVFLISINIILSASFSSVFSSLQSNYSLNYLLIASIVAIALNFGFRKSELKKYQNYILQLFNSLFNRIINWKVLVAFSLTLPILLSVIRPIDETDSLFQMNHILSWSFNLGTPYDITDRYVQFWNLSYLPSLVITNSDLFLWFNSLKPVIIIGLITYLFGRTLGIPKYLTGIIVFSGILFFHFWQFGPTGIPTIKNDMIVASGLILVGYFIVKKAKDEQKFHDFILFLIGAIFLIIKSSGVFYLIFAILIIILISIGKPFKINKTIFIAFSLGILVLLSTSGHYYLNNFIEFGNPFYPIKLSILEIELFNGPTDTSNTSILSSLDNAEVWQFLFFPSNPIKAGFLFPVILFIGLFGSLATIGYTIFSKIKYQKLEKLLFALPAFIFGTWILYFATSWSASHNPGDFFYVSGLASLRYVEGGILITELFFAYILLRLKVPEKIILIPIIVHLISRLLWLFLILPPYVDYIIMIFPIIIFALLLLIKNKIRVRQPKIVAIFIIGISFFIFSPMLVEDNRIGWVPWWNNVVSEIYSSDPSNVLLIIERGNFDYSFAKYPLYGDKFQHDVFLMTEEEFQNEIELEKTNEGIIRQNPDYIVKLCNPNFQCEFELEEFASRISKFNYTTTVLEDRAILLKSGE